MDYLAKRIIEKLKARGEAERQRAEEWQRSLKPTIYRGNNLFQELGGEPIEGRYLGQVGLVPGQSVPNIGRNPNKPVIPGLPIVEEGENIESGLITKLKYIIVFSVIRPFENGEDDDTVFPALKACWRRYLAESWWSYYYHLWKNASISDDSFFHTIGYRDYYSFDGSTIQYMKTDKMSVKVSSGTATLGLDEDVELTILTIPAQTLKRGVDEYAIDFLTVREEITYELIFKPTVRKLDRKLIVQRTGEGFNGLSYEDNSGIANLNAIANYVVVPVRTTSNPVGTNVGITQPRFASRQSSVVVNRRTIVFDHDEIVNPLRINLPEESRRYEMGYFSNFFIYFLPSNSSPITIARIFDDFYYTGEDTFIQEFVDYIESDIDFLSTSEATEILDTYGYNLSDYVTITQDVEGDYVRLVPTMKEVKVVGYIQFNQIVLGDSYEDSYILEKPLKAIPCMVRQGHNIYFTRNPDVSPLFGSPPDENANASITISTSGDNVGGDNLLTLPEEWIKKIYSGIISSKPALNNVDVYYNKTDDSIQFFKKSVSTFVYKLNTGDLLYSKIFEEYQIGIKIEDATYSGAFAFNIYDGLDRSVSESYSIIPSGDAFNDINLAIAAINGSELAEGGVALHPTGLGGEYNVSVGFIQPAVNGTVTVTADNTQAPGVLLHYVNGEIFGSYEVVSSSFPTMVLKNLGLTNDADPSTEMGTGTFLIGSPVFLVINKSQNKPIYVEVVNDDSITVGINVDHPHSSSAFTEHLKALKEALELTGISSICTLNYDETNGNLTLESGSDELVFGYTNTSGFYGGLNIESDETYGVFMFRHTGGTAALKCRIENFYQFDKWGDSFSIQWELRRIVSPENNNLYPDGTYFFGNDKGFAMAQVFNGYLVDTQDIGVKYTYRTASGAWQSILVSPDDDVDTRLAQYQSWDFKKRWMVDSSAEYNFYNNYWYLRQSYAFNKQSKQIIQSGRVRSEMIYVLSSLFGYKLIAPLSLSSSWVALNDGDNDDSLPYSTSIAKNKIASLNEPNFEISEAFWIDLPDLTFPVIDLSTLPEIEGIPTFSGILEDVAVNQEPYLQVFPVLLFY